MKKVPRCTGAIIIGLKYCLRTPNTTFSNLLGQQSTITCCDQFERNIVNIEIITTNTAEYWMVDPIKGHAEVNLHNPCLQPTLQCLGYTQNNITGTQTFPISKLGHWKHATAFNKSSVTNKKYQMLKPLKALGHYAILCNFVASTAF